jgi:ABC-type nitrate/sulfonate/bicarbonate transport system substrate-binding protein
MTTKLFGVRLRKLLFASTLVLGACGTVSSAAFAQNASTGSLDEVKLAWGPGASWDFVYAQSVNLWKRFGLKINVVEGANGAAMLSFLGSGEIQTATMAPSAMIVANSIGIPLRVVYADAETTQMGLYANPKSGMTADPKTWIGKRIGVAKNSEADYGLRWSLAKAGVALNDVKVVLLAPTVAVPAYQRNDIDGYYVWDVWGSRLEASGAKLVQKSVDVGFPSSSIWCMTQSFIEAHPDVAARFVAAMNQANIEMLQAIEQGGEKAAAVYAAVAKANGIEPAVAQQLLKFQPPTTLNTLLSPNSNLSLVAGSGGLVGQIAQQAKIALEAGAIKQPIANPAQLLAPQSLFEAAQKVKN